MPTIEEIQSQVVELEGKALETVKSVQAPVLEYVGKAADTLATRLPEDRPEAVVRGIDLLTSQVNFAKQIIDTRAAFTKAVLDAVVKPFAPAKKKAAAVKAA